ncbi:MAG: protein-ADP-ribose hydrolase [Eubacteriales bacterium]|nr:protein-ADP-ribose hydrolase [Eubacteriales bacterium]
MDRLHELFIMNQLLLDDQPEYRSDASRFPEDEGSQRMLMRSLMNVRAPRPVPDKLLKVQDEILSAEREEKGVVHVFDIPVSARDSRLALWQGDITRLDADAIVNAANSQMLGCFVPGHSCIDNAIHSAAGLQLRQECAEIMARQGHEEYTGGAKITLGYNLPAKHVIHTVGPIVRVPLTEEDRALLASCYRSCLELAGANQLTSIAFCCISTGIFRFPAKAAAEIAVKTVEEYLDQHPDTSIKKVIFNVFGNRDRAIYEELLG